MTQLKRKTVVALAVMVPLVVAIGWISLASSPSAMVVNKEIRLQPLQVSSAAELEQHFDELNYRWPPVAGVPPIAIEVMPTDMASVTEVKRKKALFFRALLPIVLAENQRLRVLRADLIALEQKGLNNLNSAERQWLETMMERFNLQDPLDEKQLQQLLLRIDIVPPELVLAQAANESAWGTSRFVRLGNNLFGQWTYDEAEGMIPLGRPEGANYAVRSFSSLEASVRSYLQNINTHRAYQMLRQLRQEQRERGESLDGAALAEGLLAYSERGAAYIEEIRAMIRVNRLAEGLAAVKLQRGGD